MTKTFRNRSLIGIILVVFALMASMGTNAAWQGTASPEASPGASPAASPAASPVAGGAGIQIDAIDINWAQKEVTIPANTDVEVTIANLGALPHDFVIDELGVATAELLAGETETVTINAAPGTYEFYCSVPGHAQAGMVGTLIVE